MRQATNPGPEATSGARRTSKTNFTGAPLGYSGHGACRHGGTFSCQALRAQFEGNRAGAPWRLLPNDFPPCEAVCQQCRRWIGSGCFEAMVSDLRSIIRVAQGRQSRSSTAVMDARTLQPSCESGARAGYDGYKRPARQQGARVRAHDPAASAREAQSPLHLRAMGRGEGEGVLALIDARGLGQGSPQATKPARNSLLGNYSERSLMGNG